MLVMLLSPRFRIEAQSRLVVSNKSAECPTIKIHHFHMKTHYGLY